MVSRSKVIDLNRSASPNHTDDEAFVAAATTLSEDSYLAQEAEPETVYETWDEDSETQGGRWTAIIFGSLLALLAVAWSGFFVWSHFAELQTAPQPLRISELIIAWSMPMCLIAVGWLLAMRLSNREARRFGDVARSLRVESEALEERMQRVNGEISLARSFLAENARELESVGRLAAQRLTEAADTLASSLGDADDKAKMLQLASNAAVTNLEQLRNHLPVVSSAAKDATNQIGIAGNSAHGQIQAILSTLNEVNQRTSSINEVLATLDGQISSSADRLETRLAATSAALADTVENSRKTTEPMLDTFDARIAALENKLQQASKQLDIELTDNGKRLEAIVAAMQEATDRLSATVTEQDEASQASVARLSALIDQSRADLSSVNDDATDQIAKLAFAVNALAEKNEELGGALANNQQSTSSFVDMSENLLGLLSKINVEAGESIPAALKKVQANFEQSRSALERLSGDISHADANSAALVDRIASVETVVEAQRRALDALSAEAETELGRRHEQIDALSAALKHSRDLVDEMATMTNEQLLSSLLRVRESTRQAAEASKKIIEDELLAISGSITEKNKAALETAVEEQIAAVDGAMRDALARNLNLAEQVDERITRQAAALEEMVQNLELRVTQAHDGFAGIDDEGFARRMALLTESLNSAAIDVAKILSNEVTDTAWAAYLKGDRGVFTRRAVRLLDNSESRIIAAHYDDDAEFRENVNRYIHDFESMMRVLLSTRDGNAIGVTMLSSDVGKLYVALAQAIERLRN